MKLVILTFVLVLGLPCLAAAGDNRVVAPPAPQAVAPPLRGAYTPFSYSDFQPTPGQPQRLISPYSVIRYDQPAQPINPAPTASPDPESEQPHFAPYRSTSRSKQSRPAYLP